MFSDLIEILKVKDENLFNNSLQIREKTIPLLEKIKETFPEYTPHDISHSDNVIDILNWFIPDNLKNELKVYEIYFLINSAYLHDVGMANLDEISAFHGENTESIRDYHHLRSEKYIEENYNKLGIPDEPQAIIMGRICRGHRQEDLNDNNLFDPDEMYRRYSINMPLLAYFLRIADELDLTFDRTPLNVYESIQIKDEISEEEWQRHLETAGVGLSENDPLKIKCSVKCKNPKIHRALKQLETKINDELYLQENYLHNYREFIKDIPHKFSVDIKPIRYTVHDFKFSLQEKEIINLLMGEKLYKEKEESLRELLKNSVDGCRLRREILKKKMLSYDPAILFGVTPNKDAIIVSDNGVGMDEDVIERYLTKIGKSFYTSSEFLDEEFDITPVNELGIGILSYFMIANKIIIDTKTENSDPILVEIDGISDYFFVRKGERDDVGTTVILYLNDDFKEEINLLENITYFARHLEFPIMVTNFEKLYSIKNRGFEPTEYKNTDDWHIIKVDEDYCEGIIGLVLKENKTNYIHRDQEPYFLSNKGIFVGHIDPLPRYFYERFVSPFYLDLNLKKNILDLNIARNGIVKNDKLDLFQELLSKILINGLEKLFNNLKMNEEAPETLINGFFHSYIHYDYYNKKLRKDIEIVFPDFLMDFIKKNYCFRCISKEGFYFKTYEELIKFEKKLMPLEIHSCSDRHLQKIFFNHLAFEGDYIYVMNNYFLELLFDIPKVKLDSIIKMNNSEELGDLVPKTWQTVKFLNYKTSSFLEFADNYNLTIINRDNRFIDLIIQNKEKIQDDREIALKGFFRNLRIRLKYNFDEIIKEQKIILKWFVDDGLINEEEIDKYLLKKEDFPTYF